jgi:hypothetical protein
MGPFPRAQGGYRYLYIAIDKFTKWAEVEQTIPARSAVNFIKKLTCRFGIPNRIITDNGRQFTSGIFKAHCAQTSAPRFATPPSCTHEATDKLSVPTPEVLKGLKTKTFDKKLKVCGKNWLVSLQSVLWSIRTTETKPTGETSFCLVYGAEAVLPEELKHGSPRVLAFDESRQDGMRRDDNLLLEEAQCQAAIRVARYQQSLLRYHSRYIRTRTLEAGDLVLRRKLSREGLHKLSPM